jgi:DNA primase
MSKRRTITPSSYFAAVNAEVSWSAILQVCGIAVKKRKGKRYGQYAALVTLCPLHQEKTPSMHFADHSAHFKCYGCGDDGDKFTFVLKILNKPFHYEKVRVYRWFKKNFNIPLPWEKINGRSIYQQDDR